MAVDLTAFPRPRLQGLETSHYDAIARRNLPSVVLGLAVAVGQIGSQPVPVLRVVQERDSADPREAALVQLLLTRVAKTLQPAQVAVFDVGFSWGELRQAAIPRFVGRLPTNCVFRQRVAATCPRRGRPAHRGSAVRPQSRTYRGQAVPVTPPGPRGRVGTGRQNLYRADLG